MSLVGAITRVGALLLAISVVGCSSDDDHVLGAGGSTAAKTSVGGKSSNAGGAAAGGSNSVVGGSSSINVGGTSAAQVTGGAPNSTGGALSTGGAATGGAPATGGAANTTPATYGISGTVTGLVGTGLKLALNAGTPLAVNVNGAFAFTTKLPAGSSVAVTVAAQPTSPQQTCTVSGGTIASLTSDVSNVVVTCVASAYSVGGTITGLTGTGLALQNNAGNDLVVPAGSASFTFSTAVGIGQNYAVTIKNQPTTPTQVCTLSSATGTIASSNVTSVAINCTTSSFSISGTVSGLQGTGLAIRSTGATADQAIVADGTYVLTSSILSGTAYSVTVAAQPIVPAQTCVVTGGTGTVGSANVTATITCTINKYVVGGTTSGLAGSGLTLRNNGADDLIVTGSTFQFATGIAVGGTYAVTITQQPTNPAQNCTVTSGTGDIVDANITTVQIACSTLSYDVGGTVAGLAGTGLVLTNNGADDKTVNASGAFTFATSALSGTAYSVKVKTQPTTGACGVTAGYGTIGSSDVSSIIVNCSDQVHLVSGTVSGLLGSGLKLSLNGNAPLAVTADGAANFTDPVANGIAYAVKVAQQPTVPAQNCVVTDGTGTMGTADITNVVVTCTTNSYALSGTITGLKGSGLVLKDSTPELLTVIASGTGTDSFSFVTPVLSGQSSDVTVGTQPTSPTQTCEVTSASGGSIVDAPITNVQVACTTTKFKVSANVTGLVGTLVLADNTNDPLTVTADGISDFTSRVDSGQPYNVTVTTQPTNQLCVVSGGTLNGGGNVVNEDITVTVTCTTIYTIGGTVTGPVGSGFTLLDNGGDTLTISASGSFTFATPVATGAAFAVTVGTQPTAATCTVTNGTGTVGSVNVTTVNVACGTSDNFDTSTMGASYYQGPTGSTLTFSGTEGNPTAGAVVAMLNYATGSTDTCPSGTAIQLLGSLNLTGATTFSAWVKVLDQWPTGDRTGQVSLFFNGSSTYKSGGAISWYALSIGTWKQLTWTFPTGLDLSAITSWGVSIYEGTPTVCQPMTIEVDSMLFQ